MLIPKISKVITPMKRGKLKKIKKAPQKQTPKQLLILLQPLFKKKPSFPSPPMKLPLLNPLNNPRKKLKTQMKTLVLLLRASRAPEMKTKTRKYCP
jgi:hypothetical protein